MILNLNDLPIFLVHTTYSQLNQLRKISAKYLFGEAKKSFQQYDIPERESILYILFADIFELSKIDILSNKEIEWSSSDQQKLDTCINRLNALEPVQYVVGKTFFYKSYFRVNSSTLIPRPETEELVQLIVSDNTLPAPKIIDIGTGSGCIAISLAAEIPNATVSALDISAEALSTARINAKENNVNVLFHELDFLTNQDAVTETFDIIVSNPPYVLESEKVHMRQNVLAHEPHLALFVADTHALIYYESLLGFAVKNLCHGGYVYAEINEQKGNDMILLAEKYNLADAVIIKDMYQKDRIFKAKKI